MFDTVNPPKSYKEFKKQIKSTVQSAEIEHDEQFPPTVFIVDREENAGIIDIEDLLEKVEEADEETSMEIFIHNYFPEVVRKASSMFFAFVFSGYKHDEDEEDTTEIVTVLMGDIDNTDMIYSEVDRQEGKYIEIGAWESEDPTSYPELTIPFRKSITLQG